MAEEDIDLTKYVLNFIVDFVRNGRVNWQPYLRTNGGDVIPNQYEIKSGDLANSSGLDSRYYYCQIWKKIIYKKR